MKSYLDKNGLQSYTTKLNTKLHSIFAAKNETASPTVAATVADMTDQTKIYVYTGSETGYTAGHWYSYKNGAWTDGGLYVGTLSDAVLFNAAQSKTASEKAQAQKNIGLIYDTILPENLLDKSSVTSGYMANGVIYESSSFVYSDYIPVTSGVTYTLQSQSSSFANRGLQGIRFMNEFDADKNYLRGSANTDPDGFTPGTDTAYVIISIQIEYINDWAKGAFVRGTTVRPYVDYTDPFNVLPKSLIYDPYIHQIDEQYIPGGYEYRFNISGNVKSGTEDLQDIDRYCITFRGDVSTFTDLTIGHGKGDSYGGYVVISGTTLEVYNGASKMLDVSHDLTIADYISVTITCKAGNLCDVEIFTNGGTYKSSTVYWAPRKGVLSAESTGTISNCVLSYYCKGYDTETQIYGDSYLSSGDPSRWSTYLNLAGYTNFLLNGYSGRNSVTALAILKNVLQVSKPKRILWCLGMNDSDAGTAPNKEWLYCVEEVMQICESRGIELILATIPRVSAFENQYKNAYVVASGYRYIDFASAVGASSDAVWYTGMLSADNIHPATQGAIALFTQAIADVPELME